MSEPTKNQYTPSERKEIIRTKIAKHNMIRSNRYIHTNLKLGFPILALSLIAGSFGIFMAGRTLLLNPTVVVSHDEKAFPWFLKTPGDTFLDRLYKRREKEDLVNDGFDHIHPM